MSKSSKDIEEIEKRISVLKEQKDIQSKKHTNFSQTSIGFNIVIELVSGTFVGASIGYIIDELFVFFTFIFSPEVYHIVTHLIFRRIRLGNPKLLIRKLLREKFLNNKMLRIIMRVFIALPIIQFSH